MNTYFEMSTRSNTHGRRVNWPHQLAIMVTILFFFVVIAGPGQAEEALDADVGAARLEIQLGHGVGVTSAVFSPNGRLILTAGKDGTARLWETASGRMLRRFEGHDGGVKSATFSSDGKFVLTASDDRTARLWDATTGRTLRRFEGHEREVTSVTISPDGRSVLTASMDQTARLWDVTTGSELRQFKGYENAMTSAVFSPDGRSVLTVSMGSPARLWDTNTGQELRLFGGYDGSVWTAVFSPDGRLILTTSQDWTARLWETATGDELSQFEGHGSIVSSAVFSSNGRIILTTSPDKTIRVWDRTTGQELKQFKSEDSFARSAVFSPDGRSFLTVSLNETVQLRDTDNGRELRRFEGYSSSVRSAVFSPDGHFILTANRGEAAYLWDMTTGREVRRFHGHGGALNSATFSPDGRFVLTASDDSTARLWETATGHELSRFKGHITYIRSAVFSHDGRFILTASGDQTVILWETATGRELSHFEGHRGWDGSAVFSPDNRSILITGEDYTVRLLEISTGRELQRFKGHRHVVGSALFSPDGRFVLTASGDKTARLWETTTGRELQRFEGHGAWIHSAVFSSDGHFLVTASGDRTARLWDTATGRELRQFAGHIEDVDSAVFSPDGRFVLTSSRDQTTRIWDVQTGKELACIVSFTDGSWAVVDPDKRFDAARSGEIGGLHWVVGHEPISLAQLKDRYYEPGLLAKKLGLNPEPLRKVATFTAPALYPEVTLNEPSATDPVLRVNLTNRGGGIGRVMVTVNGKEMNADARPRGTDPTASSLRVELPLAAYQRWLKGGKQNSIEVRAYNAEGYLVSRAAEVMYDAPGESIRSDITLRAVIVGVSDYAGEQLDLRYAAKDAEDMAKAVALGGGRLFGADHVQIRLLTTTQIDELARPTKANIKAAFESLGEAKPDDVLFIYFSGHGVAVHDVYHYPTQEAHTTNLEDPAVRAERSVSSEEIAQWLKQSPATQRQVLVIDTCAAGAAAKSLVEHRSVPADQIRALERLKDRAGVHVLMGSAADRVSWEATQFEQGLLTHALLRGMKGAALRDDSYIDVSRLFNYVADEVPKLAAQVGGIQRPHIATPRATNVESFDIGQLTNADRDAIPLRNPKPLLLKPSLQNGQLLYDDLSLEPKFRARLREGSFARTRGQEAAAVFVEADELSGAIKPSGAYSVDGSRLRVTIILRRLASSNENKNDIKEIHVEGTKSDLDGFIEKIAQAVTRAVDGWK